MALGVFAFAIIGVVFLLGNSLQSSAQSQRDSALASAVSTTSTLLRTQSSTAPPATLYFDQRGSHLETSVGAYFEFTISSQPSDPEFPGVEKFVITANAPYPVGVPVGRFVATRPSP